MLSDGDFTSRDADGDICSLNGSIPAVQSLIQLLRVRSKSRMDMIQLLRKSHHCSQRMMTLADDRKDTTRECVIRILNEHLGRLDEV